MVKIRVVIYFDIWFDNMPTRMLRVRLGSKVFLSGTVSFKTYFLCRNSIILVTLDDTNVSLVQNGVFDNCHCQKLFLTWQFIPVKNRVKNCWCQKPNNSGCHYINLYFRVYYRTANVDISDSFAKVHKYAEFGAVSFCTIFFFTMFFGIYYEWDHLDVSTLDFFQARNALKVLNSN